VSINFVDQANAANNYTTPRLSQAATVIVYRALVEIPVTTAIVTVRHFRVM